MTSQDQTALQDGIHTLLPCERMSEAARHLRDTYACTPGIPFVKREFGFYCLDRWQEQGMPQDVPLAELFDYDALGYHRLGQLGWCEAAFAPVFDTVILEDRGDYELVQDFAGRHVLFFKGRRSGFMPEYVDHPVKDLRTWEEQIAWRLAVDAPGRFDDLVSHMAAAQAAAAEGLMISQNLIGGYMYLRSLIGPADLLYAFYDQPELIHRCMAAWLTLADAVTARHQEYVTFDEIFLAEDICYNHGPLVSPAMMTRIPASLITNNLSPTSRRGRSTNCATYTSKSTPTAMPCRPSRSTAAIGMDVMSPFEVASGCDVVEIGGRYPELVMFGGIDKRVLASGRAAIDAHLEYILPAMRARGGFIPTCDHGVPEEVPYQDYLYYRRRAIELGNG